MCSLTVLEARNPKSSFWQGRVPSGDSRGESFLQLLVTPGIRGLWLHHSRLCLRLQAAFSSPCVMFSLSLIKTLVSGIRAHLNNTGCSHLKILNVITSVKILFPNNVTSSHLWGATIQPTYVRVSGCELDAVREMQCVGVGR